MGEEVGSEETQEARDETIEVLLGEAERSMSRQLETIDGLDSKASQLFQVVTLATTLLTIAMGLFFQQQEVARFFPCWCVLGGFGLVMLLYGATVCCLIGAFRVRVYHLPLRMDREHVRTTYLGLTKAETQDQLLANYIKCSQINWHLAHDKAKWVDWALYLVGVDVFLLIGAIAIGALIVAQ